MKILENPRFSSEMIFTFVVDLFFYNLFFIALLVREYCSHQDKTKALCHNEQTAALLLNFGFGHVLQYTPFILHFSALHFTHSYTILARSWLRTQQK